MVSATGMRFGLFVASAAVTMAVAAYVPTYRPAHSTTTVTDSEPDPAIEPPAVENENHPAGVVPQSTPSEKV